MATIGRIFFTFSKLHIIPIAAVRTIARRSFFVSSFPQQHQQLHNKVIKSIDDDVSNRMIHVAWNNGEYSSYPHIFLRDNCPCEKCLHPDTKSRQLDTVLDVDINITAKAVEHSQEHVTITWPDDHKSTFNSNWLEEREFPKTLEDIKPSTLFGLQPILWNSSEMQNNIPTVQYSEVMSNDDVMLRHLENLIKYGVSLVKDAPLEEKTVEEISKKMASGVVRETNYGTLYDVKSKPVPSNLAYTGKALPLHTDLPFYDYNPGVQLLHCIQQSIDANDRQGRTILVDSFKVFEHLRKQRPEQFEVLSTVKIRWNDIGKDLNGDFNLQFERPMITLDNFGAPNSAAVNNAVRDSFINAPADVVIKCYEAYYEMMNLLNNDEYKISFRLTPGDILVFNNKRILHGRASYDAEKTTRWLQGAYVDWDEVHSVFRVLKERFLSNTS